MNPRRAVFLDRDGVIVEDVGYVTQPGQLRLLPGVPGALARLKAAGFHLFMATNQAVVARGMVTEEELVAIHDRISALLREAGGPGLDANYACPHHPDATLPTYRLDCSCRKPKPGLLLRGAEEHRIDLSASFMVGDRLTDVAAGASAGCRTILVQTGQHDAPLIQTAEPWDTTVQPTHTCPDLPAAADWILTDHRPEPARLS